MTQEQIYLLIAFGAVCIILSQFILSSIESRWFGWLLPLLSLFACCIAMIVNYGDVVYYSWFDVAKVVGAFIIYNCGTAILIFIYFLCRKWRHNRIAKRKKREKEKHEANERKLQQAHEKIEERRLKKSERQERAADISSNGEQITTQE